MRSKILKAIQEGIKQSFMIDPEIEDERFVKSKVFSGMSVKDINDQFKKYIKDKNVDKIVEYIRTYDVILENVQFKNTEELRTFLSLFNDLKYSGFSLNWIDTSNITNMKKLLLYYKYFNCDISGWDVSNVTDMSSMFDTCVSFNQPLDSWDVSNVIFMGGMFYNCKNFNQSLNSWNVSNVINMASLFSGCENFNQNINNWDTSKVTDMNNMFFNCCNFNQPLNGWNVSNVVNMERMFCSCCNFNRPLNGWNVSNVTEMECMFYRCVNFYQPLNNWDISKVKYYENIFKYAKINRKPSFKPKFPEDEIMLFLKDLKESNQSFLIDSGDEDEKFVKSKVSSGLSIDHWKNVFIEKCKQQNFKEASEIYDQFNLSNTGTIYKIEDIGILQYLNTVCDGKDFFDKFDISKFICCIDSNGNEVRIQDVRSPRYIHFLKFSSGSKSSEIYISIKKNHYISRIMLAWSTCLYSPLSHSHYTKSGYDNSHRTKAAADYRHEVIPAIDYCLKQKIELRNGSVFQGYLPSSNEFEIIYMFINILNSAFQNIFKTTKIDLKNETWWTSSNFSDTAALYMSDGEIYSANNYNRQSVVPFFKKLNDTNE